MRSKTELEARFTAFRSRPDLLSGDTDLLDQMLADFRSNPNAYWRVWFAIQLGEVESRYTPTAIERRIRWDQKDAARIARRIQQEQTRHRKSLQACDGIVSCSP
jgi:hypothetical protein